MRARGEGMITCRAGRQTYGIGGSEISVVHGSLEGAALGERGGRVMGAGALGELAIAKERAQSHLACSYVECSIVFIHIAIAMAECRFGKGRTEFERRRASGWGMVRFVRGSEIWGEAGRHFCARSRREIARRIVSIIESTANLALRGRASPRALLVLDLR